MKSVYPENGYSGLVPLPGGADDIFYWGFPSRQNPDTDPLVIWLNGGPGCSSLFGNLAENGPFKLFPKEDGDFVFMKNPYSWNNRANLLYVD
jgi:carboxypeptidase C (cathepsin A)